MALTEKEIDYLEQQIPEWAETATRRAFWDTLASGDSAVIVEGNTIIEVKPDGTKTVLKEIEKPRIVEQRQYTILRL